MACIEIELSSTLRAGNPEVIPVLLVGKIGNLRQVEYSTLECKFNGKVSPEVCYSADYLFSTCNDTVCL